MKLTLNRSELVEACKAVQSGANGKSGMTILANVKMVAANGELQLTTTNLDVELQTSVTCKVDEDGETTIPMKMIMSVANALPEGDVTIVSDEDDKMHINGGSANFTIGGIKASQFPVFPAIAKSDAKFTIAVSELRDLLRKTSFAICNDETRRALSCVLFEIKKGTVSCVATDGRRLALSTRNGKGLTDDIKARICVPKETIAAILRTASGDGEVEIEAGNGLIKFAFSGPRKNVVSSKLIDSQFPNYENVLPKSHEFEVVIDRKQLIEAVSRVAVVPSSTENSVRFTFEENQLIIEVKGDDYCGARDAMPISNNGAKFTTVYNSRFVIEPLKALDADAVKFLLNDGASPAAIKADGEVFYGVIMPMRIN